MTFSILYFNPQSGTAGVATATGIVSVGAFVPHVEAGVGALTTQGAYTNWLYGRMGLEQLKKEGNAQSTLQYLVDRDEGRDFRQCLIVDKHGQGAGWTGNGNLDEKEFIAVDGVAAGGNMLTSNGVAGALIDSFHKHSDKPVALRLIEALKAGEHIGGDSRGLVSAAVKVDFLTKPPIDIRVDYEPGNTLVKLTDIYHHYHSSPFRDFYNAIPTRDNFSKCGPHT